MDELGQSLYWDMREYLRPPSYFPCPMSDVSNGEYHYEDNVDIYIDFVTQSVIRNYLKNLWQERVRITLDRAFRRTLKTPWRS